MQDKMCNKHMYISIQGLEYIFSRQGLDYAKSKVSFRVSYSCITILFVIKLLYNNPLTTT